LRTIDGEFTVADFRDLIGVTRRQAVPLLEWFDKQGITRRNGDTRVVRDI
jgi:selenocysteine-specific elongation factor